MLFVCTGNICRSALAERLARAYLDEALGDEAGAIRLMSAGTQAVVGDGVHPDTALVLAGFGGDPAGHTARQLVDDMAIDADLTLALTRQHRRVVLKAAPRALARTFTLREASDLVALVGEDVDLPGDTLAERCRSLVKQLAATRSRRSKDADDDIPDPIGESPEVQQQVGDLIVESLVPLLDRLVSLRTPASPAADGSPGRRSRLHLAS
ncbi:low molecular weight phosphatase family protein [Modestobacter lapidis]